MSARDIRRHMDILQAERFKINSILAILDTMVDKGSRKKEHMRYASNIRDIVLKSNDELQAQLDLAMSRFQ